MKRSRLNLAHTALGLVSLVLASSGCGGEGPGPDQPVPGPHGVVLTNMSQFDLDQLRFHTEESYELADDLLDGPMPPGDRALTYREGAWYVTFYRIKARGGRDLALSTPVAIDFDAANSFDLEIFDEAFRLTPHSWLFSEDGGELRRLGDGTVTSTSGP